MDIAESDPAVLLRLNSRSCERRRESVPNTRYALLVHILHTGDAPKGEVRENGGCDKNL